MRRRILALTAVAIATLAGCDFVTDANPLQDFQWLAVDDSSAVQEGIDAVAFNGDIDLIGQLRTPSLCYSLNADFNRNGSNISVHVAATSTQSTTCSHTPGGFQYTALIRGLGSGDYTLRVTHSVAAGAETTYTKSLSIQ